MRQWRYFRMAVKGRKAEILLQRRAIPVFCRAQKVPVEPVIWKLFQLLLKPEERLHTPADYHSLFTSLPFPLFPPRRSAFSIALCLIQFCKTSQLGKIKKQSYH